MECVFIQHFSISLITTCEVPGCHIFAAALLPHCYQFLNTYFFSLGNQSERVYALDEMALYCLSINISSYLVQEVNLFEQSDEMYLEGGLNAKLKL